MVEVVAGFSPTNRLLLYASLLLTPGQFVSGIGSNLPTNVGFLAYNWYNQYAWYSAIQAHQLHALSLLPVHFNTIYMLTYFGGVTSGNVYLGAVLGFGTAALMVFNTVAAWTSWATNMTEGYDVYQFFFFGWRTLTPGWHEFFLLWQIGDTLLAASSIIPTIAASIMIAQADDIPPWWTAYTAYAAGSVVTLIVTWPLILWVELIIARNHIVSQTDMVAVWLFVAQVGTMVLPLIFQCIEAVFTFCTRKPDSSGTVETFPLRNRFMSRSNRSTDVP